MPRPERSKTVHQRPAFRTAFARRRCFIPADGWFERRTEAHGNQPWYISGADQAPVSFAGVCLLPADTDLNGDTLPAGYTPKSEAMEDTTMGDYGPDLTPEIIEAARTGGTGHPEIDRRILERHKLTVAKIDADPSLIEIAVENLKRWMALQPGRPKLCNVEWMEIIETKPWSEIRKMLLEESDEGQRLRSSSPFAGILTEQERSSVR